MLAPTTTQMPFPVHARAVVRTVRGAFSELLAAVGADANEPRTLERLLGLNKNLAWKISKIVLADEATEALEQMPGGAGLKIFMKCIESAGVSPALAKRAGDAIEEYERLIEVHSGDRATLEMMGSELSASGRRERDEYHRKLLFQGASYVWGVQARVVLKIGLVGPSDQAGMLDFASLNGLIDFRRIRQDVSWVMATRRSRNDDGTEMATSASEPIDPRFGGRDQAPLMGDFCSQPLPQLRRVVGKHTTSFELVEGPVGNTGSLSCVFGAMQRRIPYFRTPENEWGEHSATCDVPAELLVLDLFFHESFTFAMSPEVTLYSELGATEPYPARGRERNKLPLHETLQDLGAGPLPLATPEVPKYNQMVQAMFDKTGWSPTEFRGFRMKVAYPACPTALVLRYPLPQP